MWVPTVLSAISTTLENYRLHRITNVHHILLQIKQNSYKKKKTLQNWRNSDKMSMENPHSDNMSMAKPIISTANEEQTFSFQYKLHAHCFVWNAWNCVPCIWSMGTHCKPAFPHKNSRVSTGRCLVRTIWEVLHLRLVSTLQQCSCPLCLSVQIFLANDRMTFVPHPPYSPDTVSCD
jgi:hypothetical protein